MGLNAKIERNGDHYDVIIKDGKKDYAVVKCAVAEGDDPEAIAKGYILREYPETNFADGALDIKEDV